MKNTKTVTPDSAYEFLLLLASDKEYETLYNGVPDYFVRQGTQKFQYFELNSDIVNHDCVRITLDSPVITTTNTVAVRFKLSAVLNYKTGKMRPMCKKDSLKPEEDYLKGWRSPLLEISSDALSSSDYSLLYNYANWWAGCNPWGANSNRRLYLKPKSDKFLFQFKTELRNNPENGDTVIGLSHDIRFREATFLSTIPVLSGIAVSTEVRKQRGRKEVDLPLPKRDIDTNLF